MYEPFPGNYVWNLSVNICIGMGGAIGEIDKANERIREIAKQGDDAGTEAFFSSWVSMANRIAELADLCGLTERQLSRAFKAETGRTPTEFRRRPDGAGEVVSISASRISKSA